MLHVCVQRFDVTGNLEKFCKILGTKPAPNEVIARLLLVPYRTTDFYNRSSFSYKETSVLFVWAGLAYKPWLKVLLAGLV